MGMNEHCCAPLKMKQYLKEPQRNDSATSTSQSSSLLCKHCCWFHEQDCSNEVLGCKGEKIKPQISLVTDKLPGFAFPMTIKRKLNSCTVERKLLIFLPDAWYMVMPFLILINHCYYKKLQ